MQYISVLFMAKPPKADELIEPVVVACYRVNLFMIAIGPVHHGIELMTTSHNIFGMSKRAYFGRLDMDVQFTQTQKVEVQLANLKAEIFEKEFEEEREQRLEHAYQSQFRVVTYKNIGDSSTSYATIPRKTDTQL